jgi:hypothetical protein
MTLADALRLRAAVLKALPIDPDMDARVTAALRKRREGHAPRKLTRKLKP